MLDLGCEGVTVLGLGFHAEELRTVRSIIHWKVDCTDCTPEPGPGPGPDPLGLWMI